MTGLKRFLRLWQARRAEAAESELREWFQACRAVVMACEEGLRERGPSSAEIGVTLDKIDRTLFRVRDAGAGAREALRRGNPDLGHRIRYTIEAVVQLRNETAHFLIRAQGPLPPSLQAGSAARTQSEAHRRIFEEDRRAALSHARSLGNELGQLWAELQPVLRSLENASRQAR